MSRAHDPCRSPVPTSSRTSSLHPASCDRSGQRGRSLGTDPRVGVITGEPSSAATEGVNSAVETGVPLSHRAARSGGNSAAETHTQVEMKLRRIFQNSHTSILSFCVFSFIISTSVQYLSRPASK